MILYLTSSPTGPLDAPGGAPLLDPSNGFVTLLTGDWPDMGRVLLIAADPDNHPANDEMKHYFHKVFLNAGLPVSTFHLWDSRTPNYTPEQVCAFDVIILAGGHVPTQNAFFHRISLFDSIRNFDGLLMGISAGSMNCAVTVYAQPEIEGETLDPDYRSFIPGLGMTRIQILPHYQAVCNRILDGRRLFEDITAQDSHGHCFLILPDGSFVREAEGHAMVYGLSYLMHDGVQETFCLQNQHREYTEP